MRRLTFALLLSTAPFAAAVTNTSAQVPLVLSPPTTIRPGMLVENAVYSVGHFARAPIGFETIEELGSVVTLEEPLNLIGLTPSDAMRRLVEQKRYRVVDVAGATVVRPLLPKGATTWLDMPVKLSQETGTIIDVLNIAREATGYRAKVTIPRDSLAASMLKEIPLRGTSVVELLSNAVVAHGNACWMAYYFRNADRREPGLTRFVQVFTYDAARVSVSFGRHLTLAGPAAF